MIDILFISLGIILILLGFIGCILPILPGPPLSFGGILFLHFTDYAQFDNDFLVMIGILSIGVTVLDFIVPIWGTKKFGGSKAGVRGATIGMIIGIFFFPPIGIILGPFLGAFIAENISQNNSTSALKASLGSLLGFLLGIGMKLILSTYITYHFTKELIT